MKILFRYLPSVAIMLVIYILSVIPGTTMEQVGLGKEVYHLNGHFFFFFILCIAFYKAFEDILVAMFLSEAYGIFIEIIQAFIPFRNSSGFDIYVDTLAIILGGAFIWLLLPALPVRLRNLLKN